MPNKTQFDDEQIHYISTRHVAIAVLFTLISSAIIGLLIIRYRHHKLDVYSAENMPLNKSLVIKPKDASRTTSYEPTSMSFNLPSVGH